jgi:hypothetical protein
VTTLSFDYGLEQGNTFHDVDLINGATLGFIRRLTRSLRSLGRSACPFMSFAPSDSIPIVPIYTDFSEAIWGSGNLRNLWMTILKFVAS